MVRSWQFWVLTTLAGLTIVAALVNARLFVGNRELQAAITSRQQFIVQSMQLQNLYTEIARALADLSARSNDDEIRALLQDRGITFTFTPPAAPAQPGKQGR
jgi:hypothetical protein